MNIKTFFLLLIICFFQLTHLKAASPDSIWQEGITYMKEKDFLRAKERMESFLKIIPQSGKAYNNIAFCNYYLGDTKGLCNCLLQAKNFGLKKNYGLYRAICNEEVKIKFLTKAEYQNQELFPELGYRPKYHRGDSLRGALRSERTCFDVVFYDLRVKILPFRRQIVGENEIYFKALFAEEVLQIDLFEQFEVESITMGGQELAFYREFNAIFIQLQDELIAGEYYSIKVTYSGKPDISANPPWQGGFVWSRDKKLNRWVGVACEQFGASSWWPNKDHLSDRPDSMAIRIEVPARFQAVSNGSFRGVDYLSNGYNCYNWFVSYPINNYNVTFYMGKYANFHDTIITPYDSIMAWYHVMPYNIDKAVNHFKQAEDVISYYSKAFGQYPFPEDKFRLVESSYEGMEHQSAIAYGHAYNNRIHPITHRHRGYDYIIVHEAAHEWWGNSVCASDMADIWLHEGFATYAEVLFMEEVYGYTESILYLANQAKSIQNIWPLVQNRNVNENTFAGQDVYAKGAALLHCLRATINNDSLFKQMLHDFHLDYRDTTIQSLDFINYVAKYTKQDFSALFNFFLYETHPPMLHYNYRRVGNNLVFHYVWVGVDDGFEMPFSLELLGSKDNVRLVGTSKSQEIIFEDVESFRFYNYQSELQNCPHNGFSYFQTRLDKSLNVKW